MKFITKFDKRERKGSVIGDEFHVLYRAAVDDDGAFCLEVCGKEKIADLIDAHRESCDIHNIMAQYAAGDLSVLQRRDSAYFDATHMPSTMREMYDTVLACEDIFKNLPPEERAKFDHDVGKFVSAFGSDSFYSALGLSREVEKVEEKVDNVGGEKVDE